jgi:hypothetical protein
MKIWDEYKWKFWNPKVEPLSNIPKKYNKISICTTCMNRTYDLKQTYIKNIEDNIDYPNIEFVLLNYNSEDDMEEWIKANFIKYIDIGILNYYKTTEPKYYEMGHSRNIAFKLANGNIVNNVDADNFINKDFAKTINLLAQIQPEKAVFCKGKRQMHGRLGLYKNEFINLGGYDEDLIGYGFDDHSLLYRAMNSGYKMMWWGSICPMSRIKTDRNKKTENMNNKNWKETEKINKEITLNKIKNGQTITNIGRHWGKATVIKNFKEEINI